MSTSKHIDKICMTAIAITLILTILFMNGESLGITVSAKTMGYENRLFDSSRVHTIDIVMNDWDTFIENCESEEYSVCTVLIDGEKYGNIGIRAKGNTSLSSVSAMGSQRYSFKLEFDQYEKGKSYYGLDKLCLNNLIQDSTMMKDFLAYQMMADFGVEAPLCSYVYITVNGEDWGLYLAVEGIEDAFMERTYGSNSGEMYKPDSLSFGGGRGNGQGFDINSLDFSGTGSTDENSESDENQSSTGDTSQDTSNTSGNTGMQMPGGSFDTSTMPSMPGGGFSFGNMPSGNGSEMPSDMDFSGMTDGSFDMSKITSMFGGFGMGSDDVKLKYIDDDPASYSNIFNNAKTDTSEKDQERLIASLKSLTAYENLDEVLNIDEVLRYFVVHTFVVNGDSYTGTMIHNYYLHEQDGQLSMIPWDYNLAYGTFMGGDASSSVNASIDDPLSGSDVNDRPMVGWIFSSEEYTNQYHELYAEFIEEWIDSGKLTSLIETTAEMIRPYVEKDPTKFFSVEEFDTGVETIREFVTLRGEAVSKQLNGDNTKVETNGLNTSNMGSMGGSEGGMNFPSTGGMNFPTGGSSDGSNGGFDISSLIGGITGGMTMPSGMSMPEGMTIPSGMSMPEGMTMPGGMSMPDESSAAAETSETTESSSTEETSSDSEVSKSEEISEGNESSVTPTGTIDFTQITGGNGTMTPPSGSSGMDFSGITGGTTTTSDTTKWIWVGVSFAVLLIGILIAIKKKY